MNRSFLILSLGALLVGCSPKQDPRIAKLEARVAQLESDLVTQLELQRSSLSQFSVVTNHMNQLQSAMSDFVAASGNQAVLQTLDARVAVIEWQLSTNKPRTATAATRASTTSGVPQNIYQQIAADAAREWPGDFAMQKYTIERQVSAWLQLNRR